MADDAGIINQVLTETSFLYGANAAFVEDLYAQWSANPTSVEPSWQAFFAALPDQNADIAAAATKPAWTPKPIPTLRPDWLSALDGQWAAVAPAVEAKLTKAIEGKAPGGPAVKRRF
jgi:2-oxoglutarate dehydrogenase E1 component